MSEMSTTTQFPPRIAKLPVDKRGYPVPWFVAFIDGEPDFRVMDPDKLVRAVKERLCWVCGERLGTHLAFVIGPMCAITHTTAEPPLHRGCAEFSVQTCPFLINPHQKRNAKAAKCEVSEPGGIMLKRNPGVSVVWMTHSYNVWRPEEGGVLFRVGEPEQVYFYAEGRPASRHEVVASIESGFHHLLELAQAEGSEAVEALMQAKSVAYKLLPP
jgi:hypothetical protein